MKTTVYSILALLCFAANSVLCRLALGQGSIDPASFTAVRLLSGALCLALLIAIAARRKKTKRVAGVGYLE